ncbi:MAG: tetratricopeptide repeat protein [Bryobacterales bacterium]
MAKRRAQRSEPDPWAARLPWMVFGLTLLSFLPTLANGFVNFDDDRNFLANADYRGLAPANIAWAFSTFLLGHWHPLTWLSLELDYSLWGMNPAGYHLTNSVLHATAALLAYLLFVELLGKQARWAALVGALLFALHPLRVESVAWVSERRDVMCGVFSLATLLFYVRGRLALALAFFVGALLSKVLAAMLPLALVILDFYPLRKPWNLSTVLEKIPFFALALGAGLLGVGRYEGGLHAAAADLNLYAGMRGILSLFGLTFYLVKTLIPFGLYPQYVWNPDPQPGDPLLLGAAFLFVGLAAVALWQWRKGRPAGAAALAAYVAMLLPVLSLLRLDRQQIVSDHHSYLASIPIAALAAAGWRKWQLRDAGAARWAAIGVLSLLAVLTVRQIGFWHDSETLWRRTVEAQPLSITAHNNLGRALAEQGRVDEAIAELEKAVELKPDYAHAQYNLGLLLMQQGRLQAAEQRLRASLEREPRMAQGWSDLGNCVLRQGRAREAIEAYEKALELAPDFADARHNLEVARQALAQMTQPNTN